MDRYYMKRQIADIAGTFTQNVNTARNTMPQPDALTSSGRVLFSRETIEAWATSRGYDPERVARVLSEADARMDDAEAALRLTE